MAHITVAEAEKILDQEFPVLNHGFVRLVDYMGSDQRIVQSARVSYGQGTKTVREDKMLIDYLLSHRHMSPFEQVVFTFHLKMPIFVARQLVRHRTARLNEISGRYSQLDDEFFLPDEKTIRFQSKTDHQGGSPDEVPQELRERVLEILKRDTTQVYEGYEEMLGADIAKELARVSLPLSVYTQMYWQIDLRNLLHFIELRMDTHAQYEIRVYASQMARIVKTVAPMTWEAFEEHILGAVTLSRSEAKTVMEALKGSNKEFFKKVGLLKEEE